MAGDVRVSKSNRLNKVLEMDRHAGFAMILNNSTYEWSAWIFNADRSTRR
jgi:hypothetical protein